MSSNPKILSDEPNLSSAALCTTLTHLGQTFRPEFTHQCVEEETFRGHQPLATVLAEHDTEPGTVLHKSHLCHEQASSELEIRIDLAPSCRTCRVHLTTTAKAKRKANDEVDGNKRQKVDESGSKTTAPKPNNDKEETLEAMSKKEILNSIAKALPDILEEGDCSTDFLSSPIGTVLKEYTVKDQIFCLSMADGWNPVTSDYHSQVQKLALWFIENADDVNVADDQSGYWKVLYLSQKSQDGYALVGYCTLFHFHAPFHKPDPGQIVRICQALVLPPFQGQGHGKHMMECIYDAIHMKLKGAYENDQPVVQINVEDPAPGFVALRNKVDFEFLKNHPEFWSNENRETDITKEAYFASLVESEAIQIASRAKITPHQVQIVHELQTLEALKSFEGDNKEELERRYRLLVKRRLNRDHREDLSSFATKDAKKAYLAKLFDEELALYTKLLTGSTKR